MIGCRTLQMLALELLFANVLSAGESPTVIVTSPGAVVKVTVRMNSGNLEYKVGCAGKDVLTYSPLGIIRADQELADNLKFIRATKPNEVDVTYTMPHGKRRICRDHYREYVIKLENADAARLEMIIRAYDDGVAFHYRFPQSSSRTYTVTKELTGFRLPIGGKVWMHPCDKVTKYSPAYETYFVDGVPAGTPSPNEEGWAFPVLYENADASRWALITEAATDGTYCGCRLKQNASGGLYRIRFPNKGEGNYTGQVNPSSSLPWATPWRVIIVGKSLGTIVESTLVNNLNPPSIVKDTSWIKPGRASWSWLFDHDSPQDHDKLRRWIDLAAEMGWEYSLIDANWTIMKNGTIHELIAYANQKDIGLLLWYNSGGPHNSVTEKPRGTMQLGDVRRFEFALLRKWGIKGVKVDFFQSDKQNIIQLYHDILKDAAEFEIMVNFHGCTLPRGWSRTFPHLMTMEAVKGEECYSFDSQYPRRALVYNTIIPFTRNIIGPMDYTPVMLQDNVYPHLTTYAHELAQAVVYESGWVHFPDGVEPYLELPEAPKQFLKDVPTSWDDTKFLEGHPGKYVVLARRKGDQWFIGCLSGQETAQELNLDLSFLGSGSYKATIITDGAQPRTFATKERTLTRRDKTQITVRKYGGFVVYLKPLR